MTIELGVFDIVLYTLLLCTGTILCYMLPHSVSFRRKSYEAMALDLLEQGKIKDAADIMDCLHWWHFTKETYLLSEISDNKIYPNPSIILKIQFFIL